ncbi:coiled-coil alpha-helical rod protein 1-like [Strongylocentrotus purpuratus]|uniref:Death domain-containing protein n=1 Tax=Strongylocentrotus purpuratus TaxID=7668 RepID=A0A7M7NCZ4_STRPU|nr:coiled-coil alpha-helical rod protein 1-like [Strongylocentrotus purpuratus]
MTLGDNEKIAKHAMEMYKERELELEEKLKSKELYIGTIMENLQKTEETARRAVERLQTEKEDERAKAAKEKCSLAAEMTKKLEYKQQREDTLTKIVEEKEQNETTLKKQVEELKKGREEDGSRAEKKERSLAAEMKKRLESKQQRIDTLTKIVEEKERNEMIVRQQVEELKNERQKNRARFEQLERETWKLRTNIQLESEIRSAEQKKKTETPQWMQILIPWTNYGNLVRSGITSSEDNSIGECYPPGRSNSSDADVELPNDEFADILKQIADDLSDEAKIDSLGSQLGVLRGDIARAIKTNMRYEQITSRGTHLMLKQWRKGVSSEDERIELTRALVAAKLLDLADHYFPQGTGTGPGHSQKMEDSHQLSRIDSTSAAQCSSGGQTNVSSNEPFEEGTNTSDKGGVEDIGINYSDWLSNIALTETSSDKLVMLLFIKVIIDVPQKAFGG